MDSLQSSLKGYYLWRHKTETLYPWNRQYLNWEFLKCEQKRINDLSEWRASSFLKAEDGEDLREISFYVVPLQLNSFWKGAVAEQGKYNYVGLSGLQNSPHILITALIPDGVKLPQEYRLILITKSKKSFLHNKLNNSTYYSIMIEDWEYLPSDRLYVDVPYEKNHIQKLLKENLSLSGNLLPSFQSPLISSPYVHGSIGGISLSSFLPSFSSDKKFTEELIRTVQKMTPPEYRGLKPPKSFYNGNKFKDEIGTFHFAERPYFDNKYISSFSDNSLNKLEVEKNNRNNFLGEYSIFSTIDIRNSDKSTMYNYVLKKFTESELTLSDAFENLSPDIVNLKRLKKSIKEDSWIQIVASRQLNPIVNEEDLLFKKTIDKLREDFDVTLSNDIKKDSLRGEFVKPMIYNTSYNVIRLIQSFARAENREKLKGGDFSKARNLIIDNFGDFVRNPNFKEIKPFLKRIKIDERYSVVQTFLINNSKSTIKDIYESVKSTRLFKDLTDLQRLLDWMQKRGHVWLDKDKKYSWI